MSSEYPEYDTAFGGHPGVETAVAYGGPIVLVATKAADLAISAPVLAAQPGAEVNPLAAIAFGYLGAIGLLAVSIAVLALIVAVTEFFARFAKAWPQASAATPTYIRLAGYGLPSLVWGIVAVANAGVVTGALV